MFYADIVAPCDAATPVIFAAAPDGLWRETPLPHAAAFDVLGVALTVSTNAPRLLDAAAEMFGPPACPNGSLEHAAELRLIMHEAGRRPCGGAPEALVRAQEEYLFLVAGASFAFADRVHGFGAAFVTPDLLAHPGVVERCFVECPGVFLASRFRPASLHAAALVHRGGCVLLTGEAGAGKSTLAYAAVRAGMSLLAEDVVFMDEAPNPQSAIRNPQFAAYGLPYRLHLLPDAARLFPELGGLAADRQLNGERKLTLRVRDLRADAAVPRAPIAGVVSLSRGPCSRLCGADPVEVRRLLTTFDGDPILDLAAMENAAARLARGRTAHLEVGRGVDGLTNAVALLRDWLDSTAE